MTDKFDKVLDVLRGIQTSVTDSFKAVNTRLDGIDGRLDGIDGRLDGIDGRLDGIDKTLVGHDEQFKLILKELAEIKEKVDPDRGTWAPKKVM